MKYLLFTALSLVLSINHAVAARDEISAVGSPLVLHYVQKVAQNFVLISEFAGASLKVTGVIGNPKEFFKRNDPLADEVQKNGIRLI